MFPLQIILLLLLPFALLVPLLLIQPCPGQNCFVLRRSIFIFLCIYILGLWCIKKGHCELDHKENGKMCSFLSVVSSLILFEGHMLQDVEECCILKRSQCDLNLSCYGQIKVFISGMGQICFVLCPSSFIFCMYMY